MAEHYDVYLIHPVALPEGTSYVGTYAGDTEGGPAASLTFEVGGGLPWKLGGSDENGMIFADSERQVVIPKENIALLEVWED